jgi:uncharacterized protein YukE
VNGDLPMARDERIDDILLKSVDKLDNKIDDVEKKLDNCNNNINELEKSFIQQKDLFKSHIETDEKMYAELARMNDILEKNTESLQYHIKRTDDLQEIMMKMDHRLNPLEQQEIERKAVKAFLGLWAKRLSWIIGIIGTIVAAVVTIK